MNNDFEFNDALMRTEHILLTLYNAHFLGNIHFSLCPEKISNDGTVITGFNEKNDSAAMKYASPEQLQGKHIDARSNIYSVGVILYEMLTGSVNTTVPPSVRNPMIPKKIDKVVMKALEPDMLTRYQSAWQMLWDLTGWIYLDD